MKTQPAGTYANTYVPCPGSFNFDNIKMVDFDAEDSMATRAPQTQAAPCGLSMICGCELVVSLWSLLYQQKTPWYNM